VFATPLSPLDVGVVNRPAKTTKMASPEDVEDPIVPADQPLEPPIDPPHRPGAPDSAADWLTDAPFRAQGDPFDFDDESAQFPSPGAAVLVDRRDKPPLAPLATANTADKPSNRKRASSAKETVAKKKKATAVTGALAPAKLQPVRFPGNNTTQVMLWFQECKVAGLFASGKKKDYRPAWQYVLERCKEAWPIMDWKEESISAKYNGERIRY